MGRPFCEIQRMQSKRRCHPGMPHPKLVISFGASATGQELQFDLPEWLPDCSHSHDVDEPSGNYFVFECFASSSASIGIAMLHACTPWMTQSFSTSMISSIVAPSLSAALM